MMPKCKRRRAAAPRIFLRCAVAAWAAVLLVACGTEAGGDAGPDPDNTSDTQAVADASAVPDVAASADATGAKECTTDGQCAASTTPCMTAFCSANGGCDERFDPGAPCDDGDPCTVGDRCAKTACSAGLQVCECAADTDCAPFEDGNQCNGTLRCNKDKLPYRCGLDISTLVVCDTKTDTACIVGACVAKTGVCAPLPRPDGTLCDDGDPCTVDSACKSGICQAPSANWCECAADKDCAGLDKNLCLGTHYCDKATFPPRCRLNEAKAVTCPADQDTFCTKNQCNKGTGQCATTPVADGTPCSDGKDSTISDVCSAGACNGTPAKPCTNNDDCAKHEDGNVCNGTLYCDQSDKGCKINPATLITCPSGKDSACLRNLCNAKAGGCVMTPEAQDTPCDDGEKCSVGDHCSAGACKAGVDTCTCATDADCPDADGNRCNGVLFCNKASKKCDPNPATIIVCPTAKDTACSTNACRPVDGACEVTATANVVTVCDVPAGTSAEPCRVELKNPGAAAKKHVACSDNDLCTVGDACDGLTCKPGTKVCVCQSNADCLGDDDGDKCNGVFFCDKSGATPACKFAAASAVKCPKHQDSACLQNTCRKQDGICQLQAVNAGGKCDDGMVCTAGETCDEGACTGTALDCDDKDLCTADTCVPEAGCVHTTKVCSDGNVCTVETCDAKTGQCIKPVPAQDKTPCNADDDPCTAGDACVAGTCNAGANVSCEQPNNPCLRASCIAITGTQFSCASLPAPDGTECPQADKGCLYGSQCTTGKCVPGTKSRYGTKAVSADDGWAEPRGVAGLGDGFIVVSRHVVGDVAKPTGARWHIDAYNRNGEALWNRKIEGKAHVDTGGAAVQTTVANQVFAAGTLADQTGRLRMVVRQLDSAGKDVANHELKIAGDVDARAHCYDRLAGGTAAVGGEAKIGAVWRPYVGRLNADGTLKKAYAGHYYSFYKRSVVSDLELLDDGGILLVSAPIEGDNTDGPSNVLTPIAQRRDASDNVLYSLGVHSGEVGATGGNLFSAVRRMGKLVWATAATEYKTKKDGNGRYTHGRVAGLFIEGTETYQEWDNNVPPVTRNVALLGAAEFGGLAIDLGFSVEKDAKAALKDSWLSVRDEHGNEVHKQVVDLSPGRHDALTGAAQLADGAVVAIGWRDTGKAGGKARQALFRLLTPFGQDDCKEVGACAGKTWASCDDDNACTIDSCEPTVGCTHTPADAFACEPGDKCATAGHCKAGKCLPDPQGRLFHHTANTATKQYYAGWRADDGGYRLIGSGGYKPGYIVPHPIPTVWDLECGMKTLHSGSSFGDSVYGAGGESATGLAHLCVINASASKSGVQLAFKVTLGAATDKAYVAAIKRDPGGEHWVMTQREAGKGDIAIAYLRNTGEVRKYYNMTLSTRVDLGHGMTTLPNGGVVAVGSSKPVGSDGQQGLLVSLGAGASYLYRVEVGGTGVESLHDVAVASDGGVIAVGHQLPAGQNLRRYLVRVDKAGKVKWEYAPANADLTTFAAIESLGDATYAVVGTRWIPPSSRLLIARISESGDGIFERTADVGGNITITPGGLDVLDDGLLITGSRNGNGWVVRTDPWGYHDCTAVGACKNQTLQSDCDDLNPCTADVCGATAGLCLHAPLTGTPCGVGKVCKAGACG